MSSDEFVRQFFSIHHGDTPDYVTDEKFNLIDEIDGWLELWEPKKELREENSDFLNNGQLKEKVKEYKQLIDKKIIQNEAS